MPTASPPTATSARDGTPAAATTSIIPTTGNRRYALLHGPGSKHAAEHEGQAAEHLPFGHRVAPREHCPEPVGQVLGHLGPAARRCRSPSCATGPGWAGGRVAGGLGRR